MNLPSELLLPESWTPAAQTIKVWVIGVAGVHGNQGGARQAVFFQRWQGQRRGLLQDSQVFRQLLSLSLIASVLEPYFHLGFGELEVLGQVSPFRGRQVLLMAELPLQLDHLSVREGSPGALLRLLGDLGGT